MSDAKPLSPMWIVALVVVLGGAGGLFWWQSRGGEEEYIPPPKKLEVREDTYALLIGCTEYPVLRDTIYKDRPIRYDGKIKLIGPGNDVELMHTTLRDYLGVPDTNITVLKERGGTDAPGRPTRENILAWLSTRVEQSRPGDRVIFHFSGHGSQVSSLGGDDTELDLYDEVLLAADVTRFARTADGYPGGITDDELRSHVEQIRAKGAEVWLVIDCCHAGSMSRGEEKSPTRVRRIDPDDLGVPKPPRSRGASTPSGTRQPMGNEKGGIVAFYSVPSYEEAPEKPLPPSVSPSRRKYHGVFTYLLARTLQRYGGAITFRELYAHLLQAYEALPYDRVSPYAEGDLDLRVARDGSDRRNPLQVSLIKGKLTLNAGIVRGLVEDTELEVRTFETSSRAERVLGKVRVVAAGYVTSTCEPVDPEAWTKVGEIPGLMKARITKASTRGFRLYLTVLDAEGKKVAEADHPEELRAFRADAKNAARVPIVEDPAQADFALHLGSTGMRLERLEPGNETRFLAIEDGRLGERLLAVFKAQNIRRLADGDAVAPLPDGLKVRILRNGEEMASGGPLRPGDSLQIGVTNETERDYALTVAIVDANHGIMIVWPKEGEDGHESVFTHREAGEALTGKLDMSDDHFGTECAVVLAVPKRVRRRNDDEERDDSGTMQPLHFTDLEQESLVTTRGEGAGPLLRAVFGVDKPRSRGLAPDPRNLGIALRTWRIGWGTLAVPSGTKREAVPEALRGKHGAGAGSAPDGAVPWYLGDHAAVLPGVPGYDGKADAFATWSGGVLQVYVDTDGDAGLAKADVGSIVEQVKAGTLDVELAFRVEPDRRTAWYSPKGFEGSLSRVLVDADADPEADVRFERRDGTWHREASTAAWLTTAHMDWDWNEADDYDARMRTIRSIAALARQER